MVEPLEEECKVVSGGARTFPMNNKACCRKYVLKAVRSESGASGEAPVLMPLTNVSV